LCERPGGHALELAQKSLGLLPASVFRFGVKLNEQLDGVGKAEGRGRLLMGKDAELSVTNYLLAASRASAKETAG
jgi:hypothetical protein